MQRGITLSSLALLTTPGRMHTHIRPSSLPKFLRDSLLQSSRVLQLV